MRSVCTEARERTASSGGAVTKSSGSTGSQVWRSLALLKGERVVTHNLIVGGGTITAGLLGVAFQSLASHQFRPGDYGSVFTVVTLITFIGLPASGFTLLMARVTSQGQASGHQAASATLLRRGNRALMLFGCALACLIAVGSPTLARSLDIPAELLIAAAMGVPFGLALPLLLGEFQGEQRFAVFALLMTGQAGLKLLAAIGLGLAFGPVGVIAGISLATIAIYVVALHLLRRRLAIKPNLPWFRPAANYLAVILPSTLSLAVLLSADVLLVKHFFPTAAAGEYAAVAALGRAIFWGASGVAAVLFPKIVFRTTQGRSGSNLVSASLVLVAIGGLAGIGILLVSSRWLLTAFAGDLYADAALYLPWYALGMTMLGGVAVLIATLQSQGRPAFLAILLPLTLVEPVVLMTLMTMHRNLIQVVQGLDVSMAALLFGLGSFYMLQERLQRTSVRSNVTASIDHPRAVELVASR
jgi:O-antigen/teichoic acid export membrane protein